MRTGMMALALSLLTLRFLPALPPVWLWLAMPVAGLMLLPFRTYPVAFYLLGLSWACANAQWALDDRLPPGAGRRNSLGRRAGHRLAPA
ncbi:hypothetical protein AB7M25_001549 [Pseudomonas sp. AP3_22 TE3818]